MSKYTFPLLGKHISLHLVELKDAAFIYSLRKSKKARFLTQITGGIPAQEQWIAEYKKREVLGEEFYFIIKSLEGEALGSIRIYDFKEDSFCWGSWLIKDGTPAYVGIESALCIYDFAFNMLGFSQSHFDVRKNNTRVVAFHKRFGAIIVDEDSLNYYFHLSFEDFHKAQMRYAKFLLTLWGGGVNNPLFVAFLESQADSKETAAFICNIDFHIISSCQILLKVNLASGELKLCT